MATPAQIIDDRGGSAAFAEAIGATAGAVRNMKWKNKLPRTVWPEVMTAYPELTLAVLIAVEAEGEASKAEAA